MPIIAIAIGAIGTAVGTAIGTAIGGTILGISAATIGGVIGAGVASGIFADATGGSFGKGFVMGAVGASIGAFMKGGFGGSPTGDALGGATQAADGTTTASMLAAQGGADFAPNALSGTGDLGMTGGAAGFGEMGGVAGGAETFALDQMAAPQGTPIDGTAGAGATAPSWEAGLQDTVNNAQMGFDPSQSGNMSSTFGNMQEGLSSPTGFNNQPASLGDQFSASTTPTAPTASTVSGDYATGGAPAPAGPSLENIGAAPTNAAPAAEGNGGFGGGVKKMFDTSDAWLKNTLGKGAPSTGKLLMSGGQYLMDNRNIKKQEQQAQQLASPMSFEEYSQNFTDPGAYRVASENMARGGRTGLLPVLLARMKNDARGRYASYLPGAREKYYDTKAGIQANKNASLARLFNGMGYGY